MNQFCEQLCEHIEMLKLHHYTNKLLTKTTGHSSKHSFRCNKVSSTLKSYLLVFNHHTLKPSRSAIDVLNATCTVW